MTDTGGGEPLAWLNHDWAGGGTLFAYQPVPAATKRTGERLHDQLYGIETQSTRTPYFAAWRDVARHTVQDQKLGWPSRIGLWAQFGTDFWTPPDSLVDEAISRQHRDEGQLSLEWHWQDGAYQLVRLGLQLNRGGIARAFRSFHRDDEIALLDVAVSTLARPEDAAAAIPFRASGHVRERYNSGEKQTGEAVRFDVMGTAPLQPDWMMY